MLYPFQAEDGEVIELSYPMKDAPPIGASVEHEGKTYTRVFSDLPVVHDYKWEAYASRQLPRWMKGHDKFTKRGQPIFETRKQEREFAAKNGYVRD